MKSFVLLVGVIAIVTIVAARPPQRPQGMLYVCICIGLMVDSALHACTHTGMHGLTQHCMHAHIQASACMHVSEDYKAHFYHLYTFRVIIIISFFFLELIEIYRM